MSLQSKVPFVAVPLALALAACLTTSVHGQGFPEKPMRMVVPFPPGGAADIVARHFASRLAETAGQQVVVDNRGGAGGNIGADNIARSPADGYSLLFASSSVLSINPHLGGKAPFDVLKSFTPIALIGHAPNVLVVHPSVPAKTVRDLIALAKKRPDALAYASNGHGTLSHLTGELFAQGAGVKMLHIPYKGAAPATIDTVAGNVSVLFAAFPSVGSQVRAGRLRALAVTSAQRIAVAMELPTIAEAGVPGFESSQWWGLYGPAGLPGAIVEMLNKAANRALTTEEFRKALALEGAAPAGGTPATLAAYHKADYDKWGKVIAAAGIKENN
ncbi:MAG: tripartite tricarboxylate transporter substrate binding protein [Rhodocyclaceae bacterium]|nr:tripartite tricarboxylate transporter substrate binding protein [Rhodocyclaceae bacterium]MCE2979901.1 tripartite tricarboxylate transporter substrate binding protein [Betaproteobacteria bacterium]MCA3075782.1 tripartite tricarboxylate transporter substrate binding protein [Rhodocyclaceae bacterium]MCA3091579.1 tripartite tricarboxylate transporter substrate binding protein [Rhodocyclaceae bacterium]MCA3094101.1 tripartite tricarboxylate transporter substrate binding protein [Rhodocyclaceae 